MKSKLRKLLKENQFVFTAETSPPDSGDKDVVLEEVKCLNGLADAINVTDGAGAKSHMSALATAAILAQNGIEPILQFIYLRNYVFINNIFFIEKSSIFVWA